MKIKEAFKPTVSGKCQTCNFQKVVIIKFRKDVPDASFHSELLQGLTSLKFCWFPTLRNYFPITKNKTSGTIHGIKV